MKKNWKKLIASSLAIVCSIMAIATNGFGLFSHSEKGEKGDNYELPFSNFTGNGMMLKASAEESVMPTGEQEGYGSYRLTATVEPENSKVSSVTWSIAYANPSSDWVVNNSSNPLNYYVSLEPLKDDPFSALIVCNKAFGEQIVVTAACAGYEDVNAQCTFDFYKRIKSMSVDIGCKRSNSTVLKFEGIREGLTDDLSLLTNEAVVDFAIAPTGSTYKTNFLVKRALSAGTMALSESCTIKYGISESLKSKMSAVGLDPNFEDVYIDLITLGETESMSLNLTFDSNFFRDYFEFTFGSADFSKLRNAMLNNDECDFILDVTLSESLKSKTFRFNIYMNEETMEIPESLTLNQNSVIF